MKVALQLYTVRDKVSRDYRYALRMVRESGYRFVEFAGHPFLTADVDELRVFLGQIDLKPISTHVSFDVIESNKRSTVFNYAYKLGLKYVVSEPDVRRINDLSLCV